MRSGQVTRSSENIAATVSIFALACLFGGITALAHNREGDQEADPARAVQAKQSTQHNLAISKSKHPTCDHVNVISAYDDEGKSADIACLDSKKPEAALCLLIEGWTPLGSESFEMGAHPRLCFFKMPPDLLERQYSVTP